MKDKFGRDIDYMRISITSQCNLRCKFCMPQGQLCEKSSKYVLSKTEIVNIVSAATMQGISKFKITGGEPLMRKDILEIIYEMNRISGVSSITLTTNGVLLKHYTKALKAANVKGINISLSSLNSKTYQSITGRDYMHRTLDGIEASIKEGIKTKINMVPIYGVNHQEIIKIADLARKRPIDVRFIEMMPIGSGIDFEPYSNQEVLKQLETVYGQGIRDYSYKGNGPAIYYNFENFHGNIGFISPISQGFCNTCNRMRVTSEGILKPCLCYDSGMQLIKDRAIALETAQDINLEQERIGQCIMEAIDKKPYLNKFNESSDSHKAEARKMSEIGG